MNTKNNKYLYNNSNNNDDIINSCNYDTTKYRTRNVLVKATDIIIYGVIFFYFAPRKRKIDTRKVFGKKLTGRSQYIYDGRSNTFYLDNKLMVVRRVSNRAINVSELTFRHYDGRCFRLISDSDKGLCLETMAEKFLQFCQGKFPRNIITCSPIICELFHFLITNFLTNIPRYDNIAIHFVFNNLKLDNYIFSNLKNNKYDIKTRVVMKSFKPTKI